MFLWNMCVSKQHLKRLNGQDIDLNSIFFLLIWGVMRAMDQAWKRRCHVRRGADSYKAKRMCKANRKRQYGKYRAGILPSHIAKTCLLKYIENFTTKTWKFSDKNSDIIHISDKT